VRDELDIHYDYLIDSVYQILKFIHSKYAVDFEALIRVLRDKEASE